MKAWDEKAAADVTKWHYSRCNEKEQAIEKKETIESLADAASGYLEEFAGRLWPYVRDSEVGKYVLFFNFYVKGRTYLMNLRPTVGEYERQKGIELIQTRGPELARLGVRSLNDVLSQFMQGLDDHATSLNVPIVIPFREHDCDLSHSSILVTSPIPNGIFAKSPEAGIFTKSSESEKGEYDTLVKHLEKYIEGCPKVDLDQDLGKRILDICSLPAGDNAQGLSDHIKETEAIQGIVNYLRWVYWCFGKELALFVNIPGTSGKNTMLRMGCSFGLALRPRDDQTEEEVMDEALALVQKLVSLAERTFYFVLQVSGATFGRLEERAGVEETKRVFAHQVVKVADKTTRWLVTPKRWQAILAHFQSDSDVNIQDHQIAPCPEIFEALGRTLSLWALSYDPSYLFPPLGEPPRDLEELAGVAWDYALDSKFVIDARAFDSSNSAVETAWVYTKSSLPLCRETSSDLSTWLVDVDCFANSDGKFHITEVNRSDYRQLSGLLRILVVVFENFMAHEGGTGTITLKVTEDRGNLQFDCEYAKSHSQNQFVQSHLGFKGEEAARQLCRMFLFDLDAQCSLPLSQDSSYVTRLDLKRPKWLYNNR